MDQQPWLQHYKLQLKQREERDVLPFKDSEAIHREEAILDEIETSREHQAGLEATIKTMDAELTAFKTGGGMDRRKFVELQTKYDQLKEEQTQLYRTQSINVQKLLDLSDQLKTRDQQQKLLEADLAKSKEHQEILHRTIDDLKNCIDEKNLNIQIIQDELVALQLELLNTEEKHAKATVAAPPSGPKGIKCPSSVKMDLSAGAPINSCAYDGERLAVCLKSTSIPIFDFEGNQLSVLNGGPNAGITSGCFTSDDLFIGTTSTSSSSSPSIFVWHLSSGKIRVSLNGHEAAVTCAAMLSGDSQKVVSGSSDKTLKIWDLPRGLCVKTIETKSPINSVLTGPFGIITGHADGSLAKWDDRTGTLLVHSAIHAKPIICVSSSGSSELITSSLDNSLKAVDIASLHPTFSFQLHDFKANHVGNPSAVSSDAKLLASGSEDGSLYIWNRSWNNELETILAGHNAPVVSSGWSSAGLLASADASGCLKIWE